MSDKYKILNCPAYRIEPDLCVERNLKNGEWISCPNCTDCLLKQIFLETYKLADNLDEKITIDNLGTNFQKAMETLTKIRKLLNIQEVE